MERANYYARLGLAAGSAEGRPLMRSIKKGSPDLSYPGGLRVSGRDAPLQAALGRATLGKDVEGWRDVRVNPAAKRERGVSHDQTRAEGQVGPEPPHQE